MYFNLHIILSRLNIFLITDTNIDNYSSVAEVAAFGYVTIFSYISYIGDFSSVTYVTGFYDVGRILSITTVVYFSSSAYFSGIIYCCCFIGVTSFLLSYMVLLMLICSHLPLIFIIFTC